MRRWATTCSRTSLYRKSTAATLILNFGTRAVTRQILRRVVVVNQAVNVEGFENELLAVDRQVAEVGGSVVVGHLPLYIRWLFFRNPGRMCFPSVGQ